MKLSTILITILLTQITLQQTDPEPWHFTQKEGYYKLYGANLEDFIHRNPKTLVVVYDTSKFAEKVMTEIVSIHDKLSSKGLKLNLAKLFYGDSDRHVISWNIKQFPFLRLYVGEEVYVDLNMYPSSDNVYKELVRILENPDEIQEIKDEEGLDRFLSEPLAFYLRFPEERREFVYFLEKLQQLDSNVKVYYTHLPEFDAFKSYKPENYVLGIRQYFDTQVKFIVSPDLTDRQTVLSFYHAYKSEDYKQLDEDLMFDIIAKRIRTVVYFDAERNKPQLANFKKVGFQFKNSFLFVLAELGKPATDEIALMVGYSNNQTDAIKIIDFKEDHHDVFNITMTSLQEMRRDIEDYYSGMIGVVEKMKPNEGKTGLEIDSDL